MKKLITTLCLACIILTAWSQQTDPLAEVQADPRKAYGTDYPYGFVMGKLTPSPKGYKPFYISHYARHGSRYYWNETLYKDLDELLTKAHEQKLLTAEGEAFYTKFMAAKDELQTGVSELSQVGWEQHQKIARTMYERFPEVFKKGGDVLAIASLSGRCVLSMSAFCQELVQCNPKIEIREQSSRFTMDGVVPDEAENPNRKSFPSERPKYERNRAVLPLDNSINAKILERMFVSTEGLGRVNSIPGNLINLYTSLPSIGHEGMMGNIITDEELAARWEAANLDAYTWVYTKKNRTIPILEDIINKADGAIAGTNTRVADLRFGHDTYMGPLAVLMGLGGADRDPEDPFEVKYCYQSWTACKASNMQLVFYRGKPGSDILVKCVLNGSEVTMPAETDMFPYYKWEDLKPLYLQRVHQFDK